MIQIADDVELPLELWRELVKFRAGYMCEECGSAGGPRRTSAHHLNHDQSDNRLANGQALCSPCHSAHHRKGFKHSAESRAKMSAAQTGRTFTAEARAKMSIAQKKAWETRVITPEFRATMSANGKRTGGRSHSPEVRAKIAAAQRGKTVSPETRAKIRAARLGTKASPETRAKMIASRKGRKLSK